MRAGARWSTPTLIAAGALLLCGCTASSPAPPTAAPAPTSTARLSAGAAANKALFDRVSRHVIATVKRPLGADFTDALAAVGFPPGRMQVTADRTSVDLTPGSILFSVMLRGQCLIGQYGGAVGGYHSEVAVPVDGVCLIGRTVPVR